jgi:8-amino-7-oxononanoate synthase
MIGCSIKAVRLTEKLRARGINALPIIHPAVPVKAARLRFFITSEHTPEQIRTTIRVLTEELCALNTCRAAVERAVAGLVAR